MLKQAPLPGIRSLTAVLAKLLVYATTLMCISTLGCTTQNSLSISSFFSARKDLPVSGQPRESDDALVTDVPFSEDIRLQLILYNVLFKLEERKLPTEKISISLVKLDGQCCSYAGFNDRVPRYPASIVKLFWLVNLYEQYHTNQLAENAISEIDIHQMMAYSDNDSASRVMDAITQTESGDRLPPQELEAWIDQRRSLNQYFEALGYEDINISQKTFPIPSLTLGFHVGREEQLRGNNSEPIRNYLTTYDTARLLYEIYTDKILPPRYSQKIRNHLRRDIRPMAWQVQGFLAERLSPDYYLYSKAGWTSSNRNDAILVDQRDGTSVYILVVFGDDPAFITDGQVFPLIGQTIDELMSNWTEYGPR